MQKSEVKKYVQAELDAKHLQAFTRVKNQTHKTVKRLMFEAVELLIAKYESVAS